MYLDNFLPQIVQSCNKNTVKQLYAFGSVLTEKFTENSDIDFVVDINSADPIDYAEKYFELKFELEKILNRPIDLLEARALKNTYLILNIDKTKKMIYEC